MVAVVRPRYYEPIVNKQTDTADDVGKGAVMNILFTSNIINLIQYIIMAFQLYLLQ